jgi:hypothetical protein
MENLLEIGHSGIISQIHAIQEVETHSMHPGLQSILLKHQTIFSTPHVLPPSHSVHYHSIPLVLSSVPTNVLSYHHPFSQKSEIEKMVQELLDSCLIHPSTSPYSSHLVMVLNKEYMWNMCPNFHSLNKVTIKDKFPIPIIDDILDELSGA